MRSTEVGVGHSSVLLRISLRQRVQRGPLHRHPSKVTIHRPNDSKTSTSPPRPRLLNNGEPNLSEMVGSTRSENYFIDRTSPPAPNVTRIPKTSDIGFISRGQLENNCTTARTRKRFKKTQQETE